MPRLPRIYIANSLYYITARGNLGENIFLDEKDYQMYIELLKKYKEQYGFKLYSFALMPAALNLLIELKEGAHISMVMHDINSSYTKYYNSRYARRGHVFRERFKSVVAEKETYLLSLINYIHLAPVRLGLAKEAAGYEFSSCLYYLYYRDSARQRELGAVANNLIIDISEEVTEALDFLARVFPEKARYADFLATASAQELEELSRKLGAGGLLGSREFIENANRQMQKRREAEAREKRAFFNPAVYFSLTILLGGALVAALYYERIRKAEAPVIIEEEPATARLEALDGTEWILEFKPQEQTRLAYPQFDKIVFKNGTVSSNYLSAQGFATSNYTLSAQEDGTLVWETMQQNGQGEVVFLRGEEKDGMMKGGFRRRFRDNASDGVQFTSPGYYRIKG